jgi:succinate dehydrogenase / fumarate reductase cytochrome b subunit
MNLGTAIGSSIGRKILNGVTGLFFVGFVIGHLTGNFLLFAGPESFNGYAHFLTTLFHGAGLLVVEAVMLLFLLTHAWTGISVWRNKWAARSKAYVKSGDAGGASRKSAASQSMLWSGLLLLGFIVLHVAQFKFGLTDQRDPADYNVVANGIEMRNVYGLVIDTFGQPLWTAVYMVVMVMLGTHLFHGTWSAFQSLGLANDRYLPLLRKGGNALAILLAIGFLALPGVIFAQNGYFQQQDQQYVAALKSAPTEASASPVSLGE